MQRGRRVSKELILRLIKSFGAVNELASLLTSKEFICLQALNKWFYQVAVSRAQARYVFQKIFFFCKPRHKEHSLVVYAYDTLEESCRTVTIADSDLQVTNRLIQVNDELIAFCRQRANGKATRAA